MKRFLLSAVTGALVLAAGSATQVQARPVERFGDRHVERRDDHREGRRVEGRDDHRRGEEFYHEHAEHGSFGYYYRGREHDQWSRHYFDSHYRCEVYCDPGTGSDYYYCQPDDCYYPMSYCPYGRYSW